MKIKVSLSRELVEQAYRVCKKTRRSIDEQVEYWAQLGKSVEDNPDLPDQFLQGIQVALREVESGDIQTFEFEEE